jgi:hypothetical protein
MRKEEKNYKLLISLIKYRISLQILQTIKEKEYDEHFCMYGFHKFDEMN